jgi:hypothetical protein
MLLRDWFAFLLLEQARIDYLSRRSIIGESFLLLFNTVNVYPPTTSHHFYSFRPIDQPQLRRSANTRDQGLMRLGRVEYEELSRSSMQTPWTRYVLLCCRFFIKDVRVPINIETGCCTTIVCWAGCVKHLCLFDNLRVYLRVNPASYSGRERRACP